MGPLGARKFLAPVVDQLLLKKTHHIKHEYLERVGAEEIRLIDISQVEAEAVIDANMAVVIRYPAPPDINDYRRMVWVSGAEQDTYFNWLNLPIGQT